MPPKPTIGRTDKGLAESAAVKIFATISLLAPSLPTMLGSVMKECVSLLVLLDVWL